jgi:hypothetical protein
MATEKGISNAIEFTKHVMTLSGAGIAFIATIDNKDICGWRRAFLAAALISLAVSLGAGLVVWSRAAVMISGRQYSLNDKRLKVFGLINLIAFFIGVLSLGAYVLVKIIIA